MKQKNKKCLYPLILMAFVLIYTNSCKKDDNTSTQTENTLVLTTTAISNITETTAICGGNITSDGGAAVTARGVCWSTSQSPTISDDTTKNGTGTGSFISNITGLTIDSTYYVRAYAINSKGTSYGNEVSFTAGTAIDIDGNTYHIITIGTQTWMVENLKVTKYNDGTAIPLVTDVTAWDNLTTPGYCWYNNDATTNKNTYGGLYNWHAVNTGNLAPSGWHVPTDAEWTTLEDYLIANGYNYDGTTSGNNIAKAMASTTNWSSSITEGAPGNTDYPTYRNKSELTVFPGGYRATIGSFHKIGEQGNFWSSTESTTEYAWYRRLSYDYSYVSRYEAYKEAGHSVRCIRD